MSSLKISGWILLFLIPLTLLPAQERATGKTPPSKRPSLEGLTKIAKVRARRNQRAGQKEIQRNLQVLSWSWEENREQVDQTVMLLSSRGPDLAPLLLPYLDPRDPSPRDQNLASNMGRVIKRIGVSSVLEDLIKMVRSGGPTGRRIAAELLGTSKRVEAVPALMQTLKDPEPDVVAMATLALAEIPAPQAKPTLLGLLSRAEPVIRNSVLRALLVIGTKADLTPTLKALADEKREETITLLFNLLNRFGQGHTPSRRYLMKILGEAGLPPGVRSRAGEILAKVAPSGDKETISFLKKLLKNKSEYEDLRKRVAYTLSDLGDKSGHKFLLVEAHSFVKQNSRIPYAYARRGDIYFKLRLYPQAVKDYNKAITLCRGRTQADPGTWIYLFRSFARMGKRRNLLKSVRKCPLSKFTLKSAVDTYPELKKACEQDQNLHNAFHGRR